MLRSLTSTVINQQCNNHDSILKPRPKNKKIRGTHFCLYGITTNYTIKISKTQDCDYVRHGKLNDKRTHMSKQRK